ncbi:MAG TPA: hypothetical protein DDZ81_24610 [Acetobacteraceae bacterium]|nr:hypothetical protein [Acetobacteraceae bacterium]
MTLERLFQINLAILYPAVILVIAAAGELGHRLGLRLRRLDRERPDLGTLTGAALGLLALLLAFSFSTSLSRFDTRRLMVLEEANAISSTANFALMLPQPAQGAILTLLRDYAGVRLNLGIPFDPRKMEREIGRSLELQAQLWQQAVAVTTTAPQSLPAHRFVASLNEMNNIHERRITALRYHVPVPVVLMLMSVAIVAMMFAGYNAGATGARRLLPHLIMAVTVGALILLVIDLDSPHRGLIQVPVQALVDAAQGIPP